MISLLHKTYEYLVTKKVSLAPLVTFRVLFGGLVLFSTLRFIYNGWIFTQFIQPKFYFPFIPGVQPIGTVGMYLVFGLMCLSSLGIILAYRYRLSAIVFFLLFTYVELIDKTNYLNHYYFVSLVAFLMIFLPAHQQLSMDVSARRVSAATHCSVGFINILKFQIFIVYFFAGIAKINSDWLLQGQPLKLWLSANVHKPMLGALFRYPTTAVVMSWAGMLFDTLIPFFLFWKKTLPYAYVVVVVFHLLTGWLFPIGVFPYVMIASTLIFFPEKYHVKAVSFTQSSLAFLFGNLKNEATFVQMRKPFVSLLLVFVVFQLILPFRYLMYPGNIFWTEEGYRFAWRVMLMEKAGHATFTIYDADSKRKVQAANYEYLTPRQEKMMATQPDMMVQFAHHLASEYTGKGFKDPQVTVDAYVTLNGRRNKRYIDPSVDLTKVTNDLRPKQWILHE